MNRQLALFFTKPSATARLGSLRNTAKPAHWVRIFKLPKGRLGALKQATGFVFTDCRRSPQDCSLRSTTIQPLGSYFQTYPRVLALGTRTGGWVVFTKPSAAAGLGSLRSAANSPFGSYFQTCPMTLALRLSTRRLGLFLQAVGVPQRLSSSRSATNRQLGSYFQTCPTALPRVIQPAFGVVFAGRQSSKRIGFVANVETQAGGHARLPH